MEGIREEDKVMETPCTGLLGILVSTSLLFKFFYFVRILQYNEFNCQKQKNKAWAPAQRDRSFHFQPEELNGRPHLQLLLIPRIPLGSDVVTELLVYKAFQRIMGKVVDFFEKGSEEALFSATSCMKRSWTPVMHFGKAIRNACPQNTAAGILDLLCFFFSYPQSSERRRMCHCSQTNIFPVIFQKAEIPCVRIWP